MKTRRHILLAAVLVAASQFAQAEWREIERFEDGMRVYVDQSSVRLEGETALLSHLVRWAEPQEEPGQPAYRSTVVQTRYDCLQKREKYLASVSYSGSMGDGIKVGADGQEVEHWYSISEASMEDKLWKIACGKK